MLPNEAFFEKHALKQISPQLFMYFKAVIASQGDVADKVNCMATGQLGAERQKEALSELEMIRALETPEDIVRAMKRIGESQNRNILCKKASDMAETIMPLLLEKYVKTANDSFVECAVQVLINSDAKYTEQLLAVYKDIKYPYAQSMAALLIGIKNIESAAELLMSEVERFETEYPNETYEQGALIGLYGLCHRQLA